MALPHLVFAVLLFTFSAIEGRELDNGGKPQTRSGADASLEGTAWRAIELVGTPVGSQFAPDNEPHLVFGAGGQLSGADGCNRLTGPYTVKGEAITFGQLAGTQMACIGNADEVSRRFRNVLKGTGHFRITNDRLEYYGATGKPLGIFDRRPTASGGTTLEGTAWQLVKFQGGDGRTRTPDDPAKYTVNFAADGQLSARVDCNFGHGTWKVTGSSQLELGPMAVTNAMCPEGSMHDQIVDHWKSIRTFAIKHGHLFLSLMGDGGTYEFSPMKAAK